MGKMKVYNILTELRYKRGITQSKLCYGICSDSEYSRIESGQSLPDYFVLNSLFSRLGKSTDKLEFVLNRMEYEMYWTRFQIGSELGRGNFLKVEQLLIEYQEQKPAQRSLHQQYIKWIRAQILWKNNADKNQIVNILKEAIEETLPGVKDKELWEYALSVEEIQILLFKWQIQEQNGKCEKTKKKIEKAIEYVERYYTDSREKVLIYPHLIIEKCKILQREHKYYEIEVLCEKAEHILKETGIIVGLLEILQMKNAVLSENNQNSMKYSLIQLIHTLKRMYTKFGDLYDVDWIGSIWIKEISVDFEILRRQRYVKRMTQEQVCEQICTPENLSRIEKGKVCPNQKTFQKLTERLDIQRGRIETILCTSNYSLLEERSQVARNISLLNFGEARKHLSILWAKLDNSDLVQCQYLKEKEISLDWWEKKITSAKALHELKGILRSTLSDVAEKHLCSIPLTRTEVNILVQIAIILEAEDKNQEAIRIYRLILDNYEASKVDIRFHMSSGTIMGNLALLLHKVGERDEAIITAERHLRIQMQSGRGTDLVRSLILCGLIYEVQGMATEAKECYNDAISLGTFMGENERIKILKYYLNTK